jgi:hypothetical protein
MAGSTSKAGAIIACDSGHVGTGKTAMFQNQITVTHVALQELGPLEQAFIKQGSIQALYSELHPFTTKSGKAIHNRENTRVLKKIAEFYISVQKDFPKMVVDILPIIVRGETTVAKRSLLFTTFIAIELRKNGVKNVLLDHKGSDNTPPPDIKPAVKS